MNPRMRQVRQTNCTITEFLKIYSFNHANTIRARDGDVGPYTGHGTCREEIEETARITFLTH